ncbi:T9SS type A sorting domain-containing protein [uncultured Prevotella sp.]|uniref:type IX secretion system anionic LPS delivery protein PorZ n=1 Tax=uncultured Prevotella sp. TaxID=159272 RepID=UPI002607C9CB|nr:T9SS type A sorting domain-containing protein [uncultured Prevotella sp.]
MRKILFTLLIYISTVFHAFGLAVGTWQVYPSYANLTEISPAGDVCFALASGSLFAYNNTTAETTVFNKTTGLAGIDISHIAWSQQAKRLVVAYGDGNIDLVSASGDITNVPGLYLSETVSDKTVSHIYIDRQFAYMSIGVGVMKLDAKKGVIADTYQLGFAVDHSYVKDGYLYAVSKAQGTWRGLLTDNLLDKNRWQRVGGYTALTDDRLNVRDASTGLWWTRNDAGLLACYTLSTDGTRTYKTEGVLPEGPASNHFYRLYMHGGKLYSVAGFWAQENNAGYPGEVHVWNGQNWSEFEQPTSQMIGHDYIDLLCMDFDPKKEGHVMVGAKGGVYEFQDGKFIKHYGRQNSVLESGVNSDNYTIVSTLKYTDNGDLWVLNSMVDNPIWKIEHGSGNWVNYPHPEMSTPAKYNLVSLLQSRYNKNIMWFANNYYMENRLYAYDFVNDKLVGHGPNFTNEDGTVITPVMVYALAEDLDGNVWIASSNGPFYISSADAIAGNDAFIQHKVPRNDGTNLADYLLSDVKTRCIAVDGANRKWMGTENGVFLISSDCNTLLQHFTTENSPLPSNTVYDICIDNNSNIVYFATERGLCSYASDATQPSEEMTKDNVYAYPNPVTPEYTGKITIVGLSFNADVKIVTSNGALVNQGRSTGGSYQWDVRDLKGKRVASGVYMVQAATETGDKGVVCRIAVVN